MKYMIDTANTSHIDEVLKLGINGVTANPSMYKNNATTMMEFLPKYANTGLDFLSAEVMGDTLEVLLSEVEAIQAIDKDIVIKMNFSKLTLELCNILSKRGIKTALTLIFTTGQACAALNAGVDYIFAFIGRNDEMGTDGLTFIKNLQQLKDMQLSNTKIVAASIKNLYQLQTIIEIGIDYAAIPYDLYQTSLYHPLTQKGAQAFINDWNK